MSFTLTLEGFDTIQERLKTASDEVFKEVNAEIMASMKNMEAGAKRDAPKDQGLLVNEISVLPQETFLEGVLVSQADYSAFVEFGTRDLRVIPPGLEQEAEAARTATSSLSAKQAIFQWCARHGIDKKFWYPIFVKIMVRGIRPHPFFFKQLDAEKANLLNRLQQIL